MSEEDKLVEKLEIVPDSVTPAEKPAAPQYDTKPVIHIKQLAPDISKSSDDIKAGMDMQYLTWVEHVLAGVPVCDMYKRVPNTPVGVVDGQLKVEQAAQLRQEQGRFAALGKYFCLPGRVQVSLEELTITGETKQRPRVLNERMEPMNTSYSDDFP
jgi:hypothetical protein